MASAWVERRAAADGRVRYRVRFRAGGREVQHRQGGSYGSMREARIRRDYIAGELAAGRVPDLALTVPERPPTVRELADRWTASRIDVADGTATAHRTALKRVLSRIGDLPIDAVTVDTVTGLVAALV